MGGSVQHQRDLTLQQPRTDGLDDASSYSDLLDSYQDDDGNDTPAPIDFSRPRVEEQTNPSVPAKSVLGSPPALASRPSLRHQESTETSRSIRSLGRKASLLIRNQPSQHSIQMRQLRRRQTSIDNREALTQLDLRDLTKKPEDIGQPRRQDFDFADPPKEQLGKEPRDGHGKGCHCIIM
jgi:hypothetical protein